MLTKPNSTIRMLAPLAATLVLAACATQSSGTTDHSAHHPGQAAPSTEAGAPRPGGGSTIMGGQSGGGMMGTGVEEQSGRGPMDMNAMCAMYREMQNAPIEQRQAMMDQQMKSMSPRMRQHHMEMMRQQCK